MKLRPRHQWRPLAADVHHLLALAAEEARSLGHAFVGTEHVLLACLVDADEPAGQALHGLGLTPADVRAQIVEAVDLGPVPPGPSLDARALATIGIDLDEVRRAIEERFGPGALERTAAAAPRLTRRVERALDRARHADGFLVTNADVLLAIVRDGDSLASRILRRRGLGVADVEAALARVRGEAA